MSQTNDIASGAKSGASPDPGLDELIDDAVAVALFGQRVGKLPNNALQAAVAKVKRKTDVSWKDDEVVELQSALNEAVKAIDPVTILDLRSGWNPFARSLTKKISINLKSISFLVFAFLLIICAAGATVILNQGNIISKELSDLRQMQPPRRIGELQRQLLNAAPAIAGEVTTESALAREVYFRALEDLRDIDQRLTMFIPASATFEDDYKDPISLSKTIVHYLLTGSWPRREFRKDLPFNISCEKDAFSKIRKEFQDSEFGKKPIGVMFSKYQQDSMDLFCYQGLIYQPSMVPSISERLSRVNQVLSMYTLWILPAIYGALGATIYFMRSILDPLLPDPPTGKIMLRVALGALAGIILGWFWTPDSVGSNEIGSVGFSLFGMSFLLGFSIDVFFVMLERLVTVGKNLFNAVGTSETAASAKQGGG